MKLQTFTAIEHPIDQSKISAVHLVLADHADPDERQEWIEIQVSVDMQTVLNGALLRSKVLFQARDILDQLAKDYEHLGRTFQR